MKKYYLGLDQGTTGTTVMIFDEDWNKVSRGYKAVSYTHLTLPTNSRV